MVIGTVWIVFFADNVLGPFQGFLVTLGVPITAWAGVFVANLAQRLRVYAEADPVRCAGRYGEPLGSDRNKTARGPTPTSAFLSRLWRPSWDHLAPAGVRTRQQENDEK